MIKRALILTLVVVVGGGCGGGQAGKPDGGGDGVTDSGPTMTYLTGTLGASLPKADILFVIDNWSATVEQQAKLLAQFPTFMQVLQALPQGLPDLHVAVVSADMGANTGATNTGCSATGGDDGVFTSAPQTPCVASPLPAGATFVTDDASGTTKNFSAADPMGISTVLDCIALLGTTGCGFPQPLASAARALGADGQPAPTQNAGFLRDDAALAIILLTNQDDCSVPAGSDFFTDSSTKISDPLGPLRTYRCNEYGHLCNGIAPPRTSSDPNDLTTAVTLDNCVSNENGMLTPVASVAAGIKALKSDPRRILAAAITSPATPYTVTWQAPPSGADTQPWPTVEPSCISANGDGSFGDPSVRTAQWIAAFGANGVLASICDNSYASSMAAIAAKIGALTQTNCLTTPVEPDSDGQPECTLSAHLTDNGVTTDKVVPSCVASNNAAPCWTLTVGTTSCLDGASFSISPDPNHLNPTSLSVSYSCVAAKPTP